MATNCTSGFSALSIAVAILCITSSVGLLLQNRKSHCLQIINLMFQQWSQMCFPSPTCSGLHLFCLSLLDDDNGLRESAEIVDVSPSITTNIIGPKTDDLGADMCERSCEELSTMFQELKGLRVVVSNLIDGLQKVVSETDWTKDIPLFASKIVLINSNYTCVRNKLGQLSPSL